LRVLRKQLEAAQALGAEVVLVVPGGMTAQRSFAKAHRNVRTTLREIASEIEGSGVRVGLENVWNSFFGSPDDMARLIDDLGSPAIGAYFDVGNVAIFSSPEDWIEVLGKRIMAIHVKDFARAGGYGGSWANLLEGTIRWERVVQALQAAGFDGYLTAELPAMPNTPDFLYSITSQALDIIIAYGGAK